MIEFDSTRGQFLRNTGKGAVGLVAGGSLLAMTEGVAFGQTSGDVEIAKVAATAELLAIDVYTRALKARSGGKVIFAGATRTYMINARKNEIAHYNALKGVLDAETPSGLSVQVRRRPVLVGQQDRQPRRHARDGVRARVHHGRQGADRRGAAARRGADRRQRGVAPRLPAQRAGPGPDAGGDSRSRSPTRSSLRRSRRSRASSSSTVRRDGSKPRGPVGAPRSFRARRRARSHARRARPPARRSRTSSAIASPTTTSAT